MKIVLATLTIEIAGLEESENSPLLTKGVRDSLAQLMSLFNLQVNGLTTAAAATLNNKNQIYPGYHDDSSRFASSRLT